MPVIWWAIIIFVVLWGSAVLCCMLGAHLLLQPLHVPYRECAASFTCLILNCFFSLSTYITGNKGVTHSSHQYGLP